MKLTPIGPEDIKPAKQQYFLKEVIKLMYKYLASRGTVVKEECIYRILFQPTMIINFALWPLHIELQDSFFYTSLRQL